MVAGLGDAPYAETVAVAATTVNLDLFRWAVGLPTLKLPAGEPGEPSRKRPRRLSSRAGWLPMARSREMQPAVFGGQWTPNVCRALSLVPEETEALSRLIEAQYIPFGQVGNLKWRSKSGLSRPQMELLALRVSSTNECFY